MTYNVGDYIDLTYLNKQPKKRGDFSAQFDAANDTNLIDVGTHFVFLNPKLV